MGQPSEPKPTSERPALSAIAGGVVLLMLVGLTAWVLWSEPTPPAIVRTESPSSPPEPESATPVPPADLDSIPAIPLAKTPFEPASKSPSTNPAFSAVTGLPSAYAASLPHADPALVQWLKDWEQRSLEGKKTTAEQIADLRNLLAKTDLSFGPLYGLGRSLDDVEGALVSQPFYAVAVSRAEADMTKLPPRSDEANAYYWPLTLMYPSLYKARGFASSQKIWAMLASLEEPGSQQQYVDQFMDYEMLCEIGRYAESYHKFSDLAKEYDDSPLVNDHRGFRAEMDYMMGCNLFCQQEYAQAASLLERSTAFEGSHTGHVYEMLIFAASEAGRADVAQKALNELKKRRPLQRSEAIRLAAEIEGGKARRR